MLVKGLRLSAETRQMWASIFQDILKKYLPVWVYITIAIFGATSYVIERLDERIDSFEAQVIDKSRAPFYFSTEYALKKQLEKIRKDPEDIKTADLELLFVMCNDDFGLHYLDTLPPNRRINAQSACSEISELYTEKSKAY